MAHDENGQSGAEDQNENSGIDLDNNDESNNGSGDDSQNNGDNTGDSGSGNDDTENLEQIRKDAKAFQDQKRRAEKAEADAKALRDKYEPKPEKKKGKEQDDERLAAAEDRAARAEERAQRAELRSMGITHPDDMAKVLKAAKDLGIDPVEAAERPYIKAELEHDRETRKTRDNTPAPKNGGGGSQGNDVSKLADKVAAGGELPTDKALAEKVQQELARRSQAGS